MVMITSYWNINSVNFPIDPSSYVIALLSQVHILFHIQFSDAQYFRSGLLFLFKSDAMQVWAKARPNQIQVIA